MTILAALAFCLGRLPVRLADAFHLDHAPGQRRGCARQRLGPCHHDQHHPPGRVWMGGSGAGAGHRQGLHPNLAGADLCPAGVDRSPDRGACAVVGHCWPVFAGFRGGMGLATAGGTVMAGSWLGFVLGLGLLVLLTLIIHHSARASVAMGILLAPVLYLLGLRGEVIWIAIAIGIVIAIRFLIDWNCQYRELWLDRETKPKVNHA